MEQPEMAAREMTVPLSQWAILLFVSLLFFGCETKQQPQSFASATSPSKEDIVRTNSPITPEVTSAQPKRVHLVHDFGTVAQGQSVEHVFVVANVQLKSVSYTKATVSCNCLAAQQNGQVIPVGGQAEFKLKIDTRGLQGKVTKTAIFTSDDQRVGPLFLTLSGTVGGLWASPASIELGNLRTGVPSQHEFVVAAAGQSQPKILSATSTSEALDLRAELVAASDAAIAQGLEPFSRIHITWHGRNVAPGKFSTRIALATNVAAFSRIDVPVSGYVMGAVELLPAKVVFGTVARGAKLSRVCAVVGSRLSAKEIDSLAFRTTHSFIHGRMFRRLGNQDGVALEVTATVPTGIADGLFQGELVASKSDGPYFALPYIAFVRHAL
jgi:hypothetical protein